MDVDTAESRCDDAEETADELDAWVLRPESEEARDDGYALAGMLRALAKSLRLACIAGAPDQDRADLVEETETVLATALTLLETGSTQGGRRDSMKTLPPPANYSAKAKETAPPTKETLARIRLRRIQKARSD
jgi:hypothetical protein